jgi:hypothetical protein
MRLQDWHIRFVDLSRRVTDEAFVLDRACWTLTSAAVLQDKYDNTLNRCATIQTARLPLLYFNPHKDARINALSLKVDATFSRSAVGVVVPSQRGCTRVQSAMTWEKVCTIATSDAKRLSLRFKAAGYIAGSCIKDTVLHIMIL